MGTVAFLRNYHIAKYLSNSFDSSHLITIKNISIPLKDVIPNDFITEHRVWNFDYRNFGKLFSSNKTDLRNKINAKSDSRKVIFFRKIMDSFPTNILLGEGGLLYIINATVKGIKIIRKNQITHIYSSFRPMADHIIAYNLKLFFPNLNWIADFRDPPVDESRNNVFFKNLQWWFIKKLALKTNKVIAVTDGVKNNLQKSIPDVTTVKNGIYNLFDFNKEEKYNKFTVSYTGSIYQNYQKPDVFFEVLKKLLSGKKINKNNFQLIYAGKDSLIWNNWISKYGLEDLSIDRSELSLFEAIKLQQKSHINLLFSWSNNKIDGILCGKLFEYFATGNPIFALINGTKDNEFENIFKELNAGFVFYNHDFDKIAGKTLEFYNEWIKTKQLNFKYHTDNVNKYSWQNKIAELKQFL